MRSALFFLQWHSAIVDFLRNMPNQMKSYPVQPGTMQDNLWPSNMVSYKNKFIFIIRISANLRKQYCFILFVNTCINFFILISFFGFINHIYQFIFYYMLAKLLLVSVLVFSAHQLMSQTSSTQGFRPISNVYFNEGQIFFTSKDGKNFGHIKKQDGSLTLNWVLSTEQKIMSESEHQIFVSQGQAIAQYSVFEKTQRSVRSLRTGNTTSYAGYQAFKYGFYVFSDGELYLNRWKTIDEGDELISLQIDIDEEFQQMEVFNKLLLIFTVTPDSICFTQVDQSVVKDKKCLSRISSNSVTVKVSGNFLYIIYGGNTQQVLDKDFNVVETFQEEILQLSQGSATFSGFKTFDIESKTLKDWKLVAHNQYGLLNTLELVSGEYILKESEKQIAKIPNMPNEPVGLWLNKKESAIGRVQGKYELLAQFSTGSLSLYEIRAVQGTISTVVLKWTH